MSLWPFPTLAPFKTRNYLWWTPNALQQTSLTLVHWELLHLFNVTKLFLSFQFLKMCIVQTYNQIPYDSLTFNTHMILDVVNHPRKWKRNTVTLFKDPPCPLTETQNQRTMLLKWWKIAFSLPTFISLDLCSLLILEIVHNSPRLASKYFLV